MRQSRDTLKWDKNTVRRQTKENETIQRQGQMGQKTQHEDKQNRMRQSRGQKTQHEDKQKRMRQSRDTDKWDKLHSTKTNKRE